jgi:hypothetical protein
MKLTALDPRFVKIEGECSWRTDATISDCDGLIFLCPVCFRKNRGPVGTHSIICWKPHVPLSRSPGPGRWNILGTSIDDVTLQAGSSSIHLTGPGCGAHFHIRSGDIPEVQ